MLSKEARGIFAEVPTIPEVERAGLAGAWLLRARGGKCWAEFHPPPAGGVC